MNLNNIVKPWKRIKELEHELSCQKSRAEHWRIVARAYWQQKYDASQQKAEIGFFTPVSVTVNGIVIRQFDTGDREYDHLCAEELCDKLNESL